jgi:hypothetical protein
MAFRANRLRVQLPCEPSGSVINVADELAFAGCGDAGCTDSPHSAFCPPPPPPPPPPDPPCGIPSHFFGGGGGGARYPQIVYDPPIDAVAIPRIEERLVLNAEDLPLLKRELELKLKMAQFAEEASIKAKQQVEAQLQDVAYAEQRLAEFTQEE